MNALPEIATVAIPLLAAALLLAAAVCDLTQRIIPDRVSVALAVLGTLARAVDGGIGWALLAAAAVFASMRLLWQFGLIGGADVKLLAACSLLVAPMRVPQLLVGTVLAGGVLSLLYLVLFLGLRSRPLPPRGASAPSRIWRAERRRIRRRQIPYACAIVAGALNTLFTP